VKLLSFLNVSNRERPGCDSGVIFHRLLFSRLRRASWSCTIASPLQIRIDGVDDAFFEVGRSKYDVRFRFDWDSAASLIVAQQPDIIFAHQVELTSHFRALLVTLGVRAKLATYCHYWPILSIHENGVITWDPSLDHAGLAEVILFSIFSAVKTSDYFFVTSQFARELLFRAAAIYNVKLSRDTVHILPCPADPDFLTTEPRRWRIGRRVVYNHRLYRQYGTDFFIKLANELGSSGTEFIVTDFFASRNHSRNALDPFVAEYRATLANMSNVLVRTAGDDRATYRYDILEMVNAGLGPYRLNANWSMSAVDCLGLGIPVVCPNLASFPEFVPPQLLFTSGEEARCLLERLLTDRIFWEECSRASQRVTAQFSADVVASRFASVICSH
jgi:glycosyltransferase involved in cell wall biosynthesis